MTAEITSGTSRTGRPTAGFRRFASCCVLIAIAFIQTPGRIVTDTKLDLTVDPGGLLARALSMWDPNGAFGQVQNQAYGYLFPMGPFFWLGHLAQLEPWVVQRLWWSLVFVVAFLGIAKLCDALDIGVPWVRILAGFAFALSPRFLSVIGPASVEVWPSALAPWVLVPLVLGVRQGNPRRMAALSALAVTCVGGVNAAAAFAVIPLGVLWLLFAPLGSRRRSMIRWWPGFVLLGTLWWIVPLFLMGRYSPPFTDYIESATNTTIASDLFDALRGTVNWLPYIDPYSNAGNSLITEPMLILNGSLILALGMIGLARKDLPHRRFLIFSLFVGLFMVTMGHVGSVSGFGAGTFQGLLDGVLAPLRNTHKFDPIIRVPLILGLAHLVSVYVRGSSSTTNRSQFRGNIPGLGLSVLAVAALIGATVPAWTGALANRGDFQEVPDYWSQTSKWLDDHSVGTALLVPASGFGSYVWGKTGDEPLQPLAHSPWAVRNLIPLAPGGNIEMLDAVSNALADGRGGPGLQAFLKRAGIKYLVVRNDLDRNQDIVDPEKVYSTLTTVPALKSVAKFGPTVGGGPTLKTNSGKTLFVDSGRQRPRPAIEVFDVDPGRSDGDAKIQKFASTPVVVGNAESLMALDSLGVTDQDSTIFAKDVPKQFEPERVFLADGNRRQEAAFGTVNHNRTNSLTKQDSYSSNRPVHMYDQDAIEPWLAPPVLIGAKRIRASTSASNVNALPHINMAAQPWAAFDGDPDTSWRADVTDIGKTSWIELDLNKRMLVGEIDITLGLPRGVTRQLTIETDNNVRRILATGGKSVSVNVGRVRKIRIAGKSTSENLLSIADVSIPGVPLSRPLVMPKIPAPWGSPSKILMTAGVGYSSGCVKIEGTERCAAGKDSKGENGRQIDRILPMKSAGDYGPKLTVAPRGGSALAELLQRGGLSSIVASSQVVPSAEAGALKAVDGNSKTGWLAGLHDSDPTLYLNWLGKKKISKLSIATSEDLAATAPKSAVLKFSNGTSQTVRINHGKVTFNAVKTDSVEVHFVVPPNPTPSVSFRGAISQLPVGVSEISVPSTGLYPIVLDKRIKSFRCGTGPTLTVDGKIYKSSIRATRQQILGGEVLSAKLCGLEHIGFKPGKHRITVNGSDSFRPVDLLFSKPTVNPVPTADAVETNGTSMKLNANFAPSDRLLVETHNSNPGWSASSNKKELKSVVANGWQQGWRVPAGTGGTVRTQYSPNTAYHVSLIIGALLVLGLVLVIIWRREPWQEPEPEGTRTIAGRLRDGLLVAGLLGVGLLGGASGIGFAVLGFLAAKLVRRATPLDASWVVALPLGIAGLMYVANPWASGGTWAGDAALPQLLVAMSLGVLVENMRGARTFFKRKQGFSIS